MLNSRSVASTGDGLSLPAVAVLWDGTIIVGLRGGQLFASSDRGKTWRLRAVLNVVWPQHALVASQRKVLYGATGGFQCSHDGGKHWVNFC